jgi:hypothetical protein
MPTHKTSEQVPHKHASVIKAWADGAIIQYRSQECLSWTDCGAYPKFVDTTEYRVKPHKWVSIKDAYNNGKPIQGSEDSVCWRTYEKATNGSLTWSLPYYRLKHKHQDTKDAYAKGAKIEYRSGPDLAWIPVCRPSFLECYEYRIAPSVEFLYINRKALLEDIRKNFNESSMRIKTRYDDTRIEIEDGKITNISWIDNA